MSWHFLERWLEKANQHSTLIGKFWITFLIVCRMIVIGSLGDRVYADEQSEFRCNTAQPGCNNVCFNHFSPISHLRFWGFQMMVVTLPSVIFLIYSGHKTKLKMDVEKERAIKEKQAEKLAREEQKNKMNKPGGGSMQRKPTLSNFLRNGSILETMQQRDKQSNNSNSGGGMGKNNLTNSSHPGPLSSFSAVAQAAMNIHGLNRSTSEAQPNISTYDHSHIHKTHNHGHGHSHGGLVSHGHGHTHSLHGGHRFNRNNDQNPNQNSNSNNGWSNDSEFENSAAFKWSNLIRKSIRNKNQINNSQLPTVNNSHFLGGVLFSLSFSETLLEKILIFLS